MSIYPSHPTREQRLRLPVQGLDGRAILAAPRRTSHLTLRVQIGLSRRLATTNAEQIIIVKEAPSSRSTEPVRAPSRRAPTSSGKNVFMRSFKNFKVSTAKEFSLGVGIGQILFFTDAIRFRV